MAEEDERAKERSALDLLRCSHILNYLRDARRTAPVFSKNIQEATGVDPEGHGGVRERLRLDPRVDIATGEDGRLTYQFRNTWNLSSKAELIGAVDNNLGLRVEEVIDPPKYAQIAEDVEQLIREGGVCAVQTRSITRSNNAGVVLFRRPMRFLSHVGRDPVVPRAPPANDALANFVTPLETKQDLTQEVDRGEAVNLHGRWYRVSTRLEARKSVAEQMDKAKRPLSVSGVSGSTTRQQAGLHEEVYVDEFSGHCIVVDGPVGSTEEGQLLRYGVTKDIRDLWKETASELPRVDLSAGAAVNFQVLEQQVRSLNLKVGNSSSAPSSGKRRFMAQRLAERKKKRRKIVRKKNTNKHLEGTEIGEAIRKTQEARQKADEQ